MTMVELPKEQEPQEPQDLDATFRNLVYRGVAMLEHEAATLTEQVERGELDHERLRWFFRAAREAGPLVRRIGPPRDAGGWPAIEALARLHAETMRDEDDAA